MKIRVLRRRKREKQAFINLKDRNIYRDKYTFIGFLFCVGIGMREVWVCRPRTMVTGGG